MGLWEKSNNNS